MNYIAGLNGLRALAVIAVVWHHASSGASLDILEHGFLGVDVFFVLSGYLITSLLIREQDKFGDISLLQFYARRTLRIFPLYYAVLGVLALYFWYRGDQQFFADLPYHLTYTSNWFEVSGMMQITWSLSTEEQFYLIWPILFAVLPRRISILFLLALLPLNQAVNFGLLDQWIPYASRPILQCTFTPIIVGALLAFLLRTHEETAKRVPAWILAAGSVGLMVLAASAADMRGLPRLTFHLSTAVLLASIVLNPNMLLVRFLEFKPISYIGKISYGVYLLHVVGLHVSRELPEQWLFIAGLAITLVMASVSYYFFERPLLRLKERFRHAEPAPI